MITRRITEGENRNFRSPLWRSVFDFVGLVEPVNIKKSNESQHIVIS